MDNSSLKNIESLTPVSLKTISNIVIEDLSNDNYTYTFSRLILNSDGIKFVLKFNFLTSITNTPKLTLTFDSTIVNENLCGF